MEQNVKYNIMELNDWETIRKFFYEHRRWSFRGQRDSDWSLTTSIERVTKSFPSKPAEGLMLKKFRRRAYQYMEYNQMPDSLLEWLALMQHHGAPTRLLDFTGSPFIACFFAFEDAIDEKGNCAVWAINDSWFNEEGIRNLRKIDEFAKLSLNEDLSNPELFEKIFFTHYPKLIFTVEPYKMNERITAQQGKFICPGNVALKFEDNLDDYDESEVKKNLIKLIFPNTLRYEVMEDLQFMNINRSTLFPGLDGFAQSLKSNMQTINDSTTNPHL